MRIIIAGGGYSGLLMALALERQGIESVIIEQKKIDNNFFEDPRTTSINLNFKSFLESLELWNGLQNFVSEIRKIYVLDDSSPCAVELNSKDLAADALGYMVHNHDLKRVLYSAAKDSGKIKVIDGMQYESVAFQQRGCIIDIKDSESIAADLFIVCDGKNSRLRSTYFPYLVNKSYQQMAFVFNVSHDKKHDNCAVENFLPTGPFAILPLLDPNQSAVVWSVKADLAKVYADLSNEDFSQEVQRVFGDFLGQIKIITQIDSFALTAQVVKNYFFNNLVLVGDAAHSIHPLAGQGLNQAVKDIQVLSEIIAKYFELGLDVNDIALSEYQRARRFDNQKMFIATDFLDRFFLNRSCVSGLVRNLGFNFLSRFPYSKNLILKYGVGV